MSLSEQQVDRYSRQLLLPNMSSQLQEKLLHSKVLIIGAGGLGCPAGLYLAAAGVGHIGIADHDTVDLSNLQRQILHKNSDIGIKKSLSAAESLSAINTDVNIKTYCLKVSAENILDLISDYDFIIDGSDNFETKFLINDACVMMNKPASFAGIHQFSAQILTYIPGYASYRCAFKEPPSLSLGNCSSNGILGSVAGVVGTIQATETLKHLLFPNDVVINSLLVVNLIKLRFKLVTIKPDTKYLNHEYLKSINQFKLNNIKNKEFSHV